MSRRVLALLAALVFPSVAAAQGGFSPDDAVKRMKLPEGFSVRCVAAEPMIRQPVSISFDARGRLWVLQYLQYPNYAGLKPVKQDQYLRTIWDKVPEPPPHGPKGADRLTICYDPDENGVFRKSKDFVTGLNIASGFCLGNGGVYVVQPPYLLFYPDKDEDDIPDGDPEVLLSGFGMDDTHSLANSLQWGPDGWLYGAAGSTSTCRIKNPAWRAGGVNPPSPEVVEFQQGIWRYHPKTKVFELFSEGGGNTYGLDFDKHGQVIAGTNWGGFACLHQLQGAYYVKGFSKHGPLHNPHTYGYFDHVPYTGFKGGHVTCGGVLYQADAYPPEYRDKYIAGNLLSNAVYWHRLEPFKSSFKATHGGDLLLANDTWFRPVDLTLGPDGCVYVADWYDRRAAHLDPVDNWDKTNGRVYRIEYKGAPKLGEIDLRKKTSAELVELLKHPNKWWRNEARRLLAERQDKGTYSTLRKWLREERGLLALESLWALYVSGGWDQSVVRDGLAHSSDHIQAWAWRLFDTTFPENDTIQAMYRASTPGASPVLLAQIACTAKRMDPKLGILFAAGILEYPECQTDPQLPLLIWWAWESIMTRQPELSLAGLWKPGLNPPPVTRFIAERVARRLMAGDVPDGPKHLAELFDHWQSADAAPILTGLLRALEGRRLDAVPDPLFTPLTHLWAARRDDMLLVEVFARMNDAKALGKLRDRLSASDTPEKDRVKVVDILRQLRDPRSKDLFLAQLTAARSDATRTALLGGLEAFDDPALADAVFAHYPEWSPAVRKRAVQFLLSRPVWTLALMQRFDAGTFPKADVTLDHAKAAVGLNDAKVTALVEKHFGKLAPATAGEKQARIAWLSRELNVGGRGDPAKGKLTFTKLCAACHQLHAEGGKVGPDLTTADRKNRTYMLTQIVDPSGYIRPEYVVHNVSTTDGRKLLGIVTESAGASVTLVNVVNDQPQKTVVAKADVEDMKPSAVSLMPEKLLDSLSYPEIVDLFAYLASDAPAPKNPGADTPGSPRVAPANTPGSPRVPPANTPGSPRVPPAKKRKVCLVSGSLEYKSDESLAAFKTHLEANYPVECVMVSAKAEKDKDMPGLENLEACDVAIFFTRRLQIDGPALEKVKAFVNSGKPIVGVRTASHGFQNWLAMDAEVFGGNYKGHFGQKIACTIAVEPRAKDHPVLRSVGGFKTTGGLYKNPDVSGDVTVLLRGTIPMGTEPVAWVREKDGRRVFYTSLGAPDDFKDPNFTRLLVNALAWVTKSDWLAK